jgi:hypothetical protein
MTRWDVSATDNGQAGTTLLGRCAPPFTGPENFASDFARHTWGSSAVITSCARSINQVSLDGFPLDVPQPAGRRKPVSSFGGSLLAKVRGPHECHEAKQACGPPSQMLFGVDSEMPQGSLEDGDSRIYQTDVSEDCREVEHDRRCHGSVGRSCIRIPQTTTRLSPSCVVQVLKSTSAASLCRQSPRIQELWSG